MARNINYNNELENPDIYYVVCHFDKDGNCSKEHIKLTPSGIQGLTEGVITVIRDLNKEEHQNDLQNDRYLVDPRYKAVKAKRKDLAESVIIDKFHEHIEPLPELDEELECRHSFVDNVHSLLPQLTESQQNLYKLTSEGHSLQEIADMEGTTKNAIASRMKKLKARLYTLYNKTFGL